MDKGRTKRSGWTWGVIGGICGFAGICAALFGGLLTASTWVLGAELHPWLQNSATALLLSTIPLLIIAGYCLDWMEREPKKPATGKARHEQRENNPPSQRTVAAVLLLTFCAAPVELRAQQTIFNVPTTDVLDKGKVYAELDVPFKPNDGDDVKKFSAFVPRLVVGAGGRAEIGLNLTGNIQPGADVTSLVPTVKFKLYDGSDNGYDLVVGDNLTIPVRNRDLVTYDV
ncbi:MAG: hypothetical protein M3371_01895, partial [Acidobacteriota bacterium]|nr:hypothetical protein [Acidobacteriota bacterium]